MLEISEKWDEQEGRPEKPIGTLAECLAFTLSVDIDSIKGRNGEDITTSPEIKAAVEAAGQFFVDHLREQGISKSVHCLYSGGGVYVHIHHALFRAGADWTPEDRELRFRSLTLAYNALIAEIERMFFEAHPEHEGKVKFDKLNNQKRKFKVLFSIHRRLPVAVIPMNPDHIEIDFSKAKLPLSDKVLADGARWYQSYDLSEKEALKTLLAPFVEPAEDELKERKVRTGNYEIYRAPVPVPVEKFPPCIKNIMQKVASGLGPHRACAVLAAYLYQTGLPKDESWTLWTQVADRCGVEGRIFDCWYGLMICPSGSTIQEAAAGYPKVGLGGLGYCLPEELCKNCRSPVNYGNSSLFDITGITEEELKGRCNLENPQLRVRLESDNIIIKYIEYGKSTCDAYPEYHYGLALALLSIATNRNLVLKLKQGDVFPNMWLFLLGRSTISRKSAAMSKGHTFAQSLFSWKDLPQSYSPEGMIEILSENPQAYLLKDEAGSMLEAMQKNYMLEMRDLYCILYDCQNYSRKLRKGQRKEKTEFNILHPFINMVSATTPETFREYTSMLDLTSGWLLRFLYIYPTYCKEWMPFKPETDEDFALFGEFMGRISKVKAIFYNLERPVEIALSQEAWAYYQTWQETRERELQETTNFIELALWGRLAFYALKLAMLFTVGRSDYQLGMQASLAHVEEACRQIDEYFLPVGLIVAEEVAREETTNLQNKIIGTLNRNGGKIKKRDFLKKLHVKLKDVNEALEALSESEEIEVFEAKGKGGPAIWILLKQKNIKERAQIKPKSISENKVPQNRIDVPEQYTTIRKINAKFKARCKANELPFNELLTEPQIR